MAFSLANLEFSSRGNARHVNLPSEINKDIAELVGTIIGDGHLHIGRRGTTTDYYISIAFNATEDMPYVKYLAMQFERLFGATVHMRLRSHSNELLVRSKGIAHFFNDIGIPAGRKASIVEIPAVILEDGRYVRACIRGIFDTDFSLTFKKKHRRVHYYPVISFSSVSLRLRDQMLHLLSESGFRNIYAFDRIQVTRTGTPVQVHELYISGVAELERWMTLIGTSNPRHQTKYLLWKEFGSCPPGTSLAQRVDMLNGLKTWNSKL